jgi:hypothetical protein
MQRRDVSHVLRVEVAQFNQHPVRGIRWRLALSDRRCDLCINVRNSSVLKRKNDAVQGITIDSRDLASSMINFQTSWIAN